MVFTFLEMERDKTLLFYDFKIISLLNVQMLENTMMMMWIMNLNKRGHSRKC